MGDGRGVYIPPEIWAMSKLSVSERVMLAEIVFLDSNGQCFASNDHFARLLDCSKSNARKMVYNLIECGAIVRLSKNGHGQRVLCPNAAIVGVQNWTPPRPDLDTIENKVKTKPKKQRVARTCPNLDTCQNWFAENGAAEMAGAFFDYYETNGWVQGAAKKPIRNWEAAARGWIRRQKQYNGEKQQRGFNRQKFDAGSIAAWANDKNNGGVDRGPRNG